MPRYAQIEREALADDLLSVDADAPTLCAGWTARDLAAHLVARERRADAAPGVLLGGPFAGWTDAVRRHYREKYSYPELVALVRKVDWWNPMRLAPVDEALNTVEFYVHHEDIRRAQPDWQARPLDPGLERALWGRVPGLARLSLRGFPAAVAVAAPGHGEFTVGAGEPAVRVEGPPSELVLYFFGRRRVARAVVTGPEELTDKLRRRG